MAARFKDGGLRLWWLMAGEHLGLVFAAALAVIFAGGLMAASLPTGPTVQVHAEVVALSVLVHDSGADIHIIARVDGRRVRVTLLAANTCKIGDRITLNRTPRLAGPAYTATGRPCVPSSQA